MNKPLYKVIYDDILSQINNGILKIGHKIPSEKELAEQYDVSRITSKKALDLLAQDEIIERIQGKGSFVAQILEQKSNQTGQSTTIKHSDIEQKLKVGLVISDFSDSFGSILVKEIEKNVTANNGILLIKISNENLQDEEKAIQELLDVGVNGIIILPIHGEHYNTKILELVLKQFPIVLVDRYLRGIQASSVSTDNMKAVQVATEYLLSMGHQRIAYVTPPYDGTTVLEDRLKGYQLTYSERHLHLNREYLLINSSSDFPLEQRSKSEFSVELEKFKRFLYDYPEITAFVVARYGLAEILFYVLQSMGKKVPEDYSIICFDSPIADIGKPKFTHIAQNEYKMAKTAVKLLNAQIEGKSEIIAELINFKLIEGHSTKALEVKN